ncbi:MAG: beta-lactamase family protein [Caulobacteraceae bacterium]|nr:beta-lactamase family protein [Caulobacteraceae bacterium]
MLTRALVILSLACTLPACPAQAAEANPAPRIAAYLAARERLGQFNGVVLAMRDGKVLFERAYGWADVQHDVRNSTDTRFNVASITKQFTATAILQLRDAGRLSLDDSICRFVDPCPAAWRPVTLKHLLNHTAGVPDYEAPLELGSADYTAFIGRPDNIERILADASSKPLDFAPGSRWNYSNTGYILLARVVAKVSGETYGHYIENHVLAPAGMTASSIDNGLVQRNGALGYAAGGGLTLTQIASGMRFDRLPLVQRWQGDLHGDHGDAALWTTATDLGRWVTALEGGRILSPNSLAEMKDGGQFGYGYGLEIANVGERLRLRHTGQVNGYISVVQWYPAEHIVLVAVTNYENGRVSAVMRDLAAIVFGQPYDMPASHRLIETDPSAYAPLLGDYMFGDQPARLKVEASMLLLEVPGQFTAGLLPEEGGTFYVPFLEGVARLAPDGSGLIMHSRGVDTPLVRKPATQARGDHTAGTTQ